MELIRFILFYFSSKNLSLVTVFLCWDPDELIELWRSAHTAGVRVNIQSISRLPELPTYRLHREGALLDVDCPGAELHLQKASSYHAFNNRYTWLLLHNSTVNTTVMERLLSNVAILPDADLTWASTDTIVDVYRIKADEPLVVKWLGLRRNCSLEDLKKLWRELPAAVTRRRNLRNVYLKAATIISQPQHFKGWSDLSNRQIDTYPKLTYPLMMLCAEDLNFRYNLMQVDLYGEEKNGTFDGLAGMLQRQQIEVGITSMFMRTDRSRVLHYSSETVTINGAFLFRQPSQSAVSNMFLLPFSRGVWMACALVFLASVGFLAAFSRGLMHADPSLTAITLPETITFSLGTICQQGFHITPNLLSIRMVMFFTLLTSLFTFTSYSAKIVAILQTPSNSIRTIRDLTRSPMTLGVQETTYKKVYFAESTEPATQELYRLKLLPQGDRAYISVVDGITRVRTGLFAFQVEQSSGYEIVSKTYTEREKCDLKEIQAFKLPTVAVPIRKHSGYKQLFATRLRWQRETGLMDRFRRIWLSSRPRCDSASGGFVSVRLEDVLPAVHVLAAGALLAALSLIVERAVHTVRSHGRVTT